MSGPDEIPILEREYAARQLIFVTTDLIAQAARGRRPDVEEGFMETLKGEWRKTSQSLANKDWTGAATSILQLHAQITRSLTLTGWLGTAAAEAVRAWARAQESGVQILPVGQSAAKQIRFPPGHPRNDVLYVGHPALPDVYYPMADFHRVTFEHKFCEAVDLLMNLGATKMRVEHVAGWSKEFSARISVPLGTSSETGAIETSKKASSRTNLLYEATLTGTDTPKVPNSLVWYHHEPTWQAVAKGRISFGLSDFSLSVTYEDDFGINAGLKAAVVKAGLDLGGKFEDHQSTVWRLEGTFTRPSHPQERTFGQGPRL
jgi:hypothetical protein